jgi:putative FmdB family regulatory protein
MPIYEYECDKCGAHLEVLQKMGDKALTRCTKCRGKVRKVVSRSSFQLKGSGWYVTDYAKKGSSSTETKPETKSETKSTTESKSEAKPAATASSTVASGKSD